MKKGRRRSAGTLAVSVAAAAGLVACGGGSSSSTTTPLTQADFVAKATAICVPANKQIEDAAHQDLGAGRPTAADFQRFVSTAVVPDTQRQIDGYRALTPPASAAATYRQFVSELQAENDKLKSNPQLLAQPGNPFAHIQALAKQVGLGACAKG